MTVTPDLEAVLERLPLWPDALREEGLNVGTLAADIDAVVESLRTGQLVLIDDQAVEQVALSILNSDRIMHGLEPIASRENCPDSDGYVTNAQAAITALRTKP